MKLLRLALSVALLFALAAGYFASQWFALNGRAPEWTALIDTPVVVWLALIVLVVGIILWLIPEREEKRNP